MATTQVCDFLAHLDSKKPSTPSYIPSSPESGGSLRNKSHWSTSRFKLSSGFHPRPSPGCSHPLPVPPSSSLLVFSIPQILNVSFCLTVGLCYSFCLECHSPRSLCRLTAHLSVLHSPIPSSLRPPWPFTLQWLPIATSLSYLVLSPLTLQHCLIYVIVYLLVIFFCSNICFTRAGTISALFSAVSPEPRIGPGSGSPPPFIYWTNEC